MPTYGYNQIKTICSTIEKKYSPPPSLTTITNNIFYNPDCDKAISVPLIPSQIEKIDILNQMSFEIIEEPGIQNQVPEKHAIVMINKRKRKMKKHKLKKLRIRMKFEWAKIRQKRELRKEKAFQLEMSSKVKEGERFSAEQFVEDQLNKIHAEQLHERWNNVPEWFIKERMERKQNNRNQKIAREERRKALHSVYVKDWGVEFLKTQ